MIINLNLEGKKIIIIGGGIEAEKRIKSIFNEICEILIISDSINEQISKWVKIKKINQKIIKYAKNRKIIVYSSDNPDDSDFSNAAIIDFEKTIQIAIFTGGRSPAMSKKIKSKSEKALKKVILKEDIAQIKIQKISRTLAKEIIPTQFERKQCLNNIMNDNQIDQLIKDGQVKKAEKRAREIIKKWK